MPPLGEHADSGSPDGGVYVAVDSPRDSDCPKIRAEAGDPVECYRCECSGYEPKTVSVRFGDSAVCHAAQCEAPEQAGVDYSKLYVSEVELFSHHWSGWPVVESAHVDEQVEPGVTK